MHAKSDTPAGQDLILSNLLSVSKGRLLDGGRRDLLAKKGLIRKGAYRDFLTEEGREHLGSLGESA